MGIHTHTHTHTYIYVRDRHRQRKFRHPLGGLGMHLPWIEGKYNKQA
jgi:hypothetical protein